MYNRTHERDVFVTSLPYMDGAKALAVSKGMNDHGPLHAQRVYSHARRLSALAGLTPRECDLLCAAALLHDIGMAKDRENHHKTSADLVRSLSSEGKLPFSRVEANLVATLCEWHRREYNPSAVNQRLKVRTGLLGSLLRIADAVDLDYRRADDYRIQEPVIAHVHEGQAIHHISVQSTLGARFYASRMGTEVQLLIDKMPSAGLQLVRLVEELVGTPIAWPVKLIPVRSPLSSRDSVEAGRTALLFSYCNAHGIVQAGISKRALEIAGFRTKVVCDMHTATPESFWKEAIGKWDFSNYQLVAILGLDLPEEACLLQKLTSQFPRCRWLYASPLEHGPERIASLLRIGVDVLLGDARLLFAGDALPADAVPWMRIAGLCNADDWLTSSGSFTRDEFLAARGLRLELLHLIEAGADSKAFSALVDRVAKGDLAFFSSKEPNWSTVLAARLAEVSRRGRVVILTGSTIPGRLAYDLAHLAIERQGVVPWDKNEFTTPYAIFRKSLPSGKERVLYLSRFSRLDSAVPVKYFVQYTEDQLGSGATIWQTYPSRKLADSAIEATVKAINNYYQCDV